MAEKQEKIIIKGRLNGRQRQRLASLMDMMYSPSELAEEIGFDRRNIYQIYIPLGCPHKRDEKRYIWINGVEFKNWIKDIYKKTKLHKDEAFCIGCKSAVKMTNSTRKEAKGIVYYLCKCPTCGRKLSRIITRGER